MKSGVFEALLNSASVSFNALFGGVASRRLPPAVVVLVASLASAVVACILVIIQPAPPQAMGILIGAIAGVSGGFGIYLSYRALAEGPIGPVAAIIGCTGVGLVSAVGLAQRGAATPPHLAALALCVVSVVMVSVRTLEHRVASITLMVAIGAGVVSGSFSILMDQTSASDGWWPLLAVRLGVVAFAIPFALVLLRRRASKRVQAPLWLWVVAASAGVMDALGNMFLILALQSIDLATLAIFAAITPALTALLSVVLIREPITVVQTVGVGVAVLAIWLASIP